MERVRLTVGAVAHGGHCVARHDGRVVFVRHALPGEVVEAVATGGREGDRFWRADAVAVIEASPDRVESVWPDASPAADGTGGVGGGELAHVALPAQREWKRTVIQESFERFGKVEFAGEVRSAPGDDERAGLRYRTRVAAIAGADGRASMRVHRSHDFRPLSSMPLATEEAEEALLGSRYPSGGKILVVDPSGEDGTRVFVDGKPWRAGAQDHRPNARTHVREVVGDGGAEYRYRVAATGFWQVHREAPAILTGEVLARCGDAGRVLDLYAGSGLFTVPLAAGREVVSVESEESAVKDARRNLHAHPNATVVKGDVRQTLRSGLGRVDAVVLDPPRSGAGAATLEALTALEPATIVYVACDPVALARDIATLSTLGYDLGDVAAWDLFPMTHHVETVVLMSRCTH